MLWFGVTTAVRGRATVCLQATPRQGWASLETTSPTTGTWRIELETNLREVWSFTIAEKASIGPSPWWKQLLQHHANFSAHTKCRLCYGEWGCEQSILVSWEKLCLMITADNLHLRLIFLCFCLIYCGWQCWYIFRWYLNMFDNCFHFHVSTK